jgi:3-hydroxybutyryl-CoA dehydrogenase
MLIDDIQKICVSGAGQMGSQIALQAALHGFTVALHDISEEQLEKAMAGNRTQLERRVAKGKLQQEDVDAALARLTPTHDLAEAAQGADFVVEAIVEILEAKKDLFRELDRLTPKHAILATNSSYLGNSQIAPATSRPEKVVNMHFFFPPMVMKLVEVVKGEQTSDETVALTAEVARRIGKVPVVLNKELPGFLVNRVLRAISNEAYFLLENDVASFTDIDLACELGLNHPMGPFKLADFSGLDIGYNARMEVYNKSGDEKDRPAGSLERRVERGDVGRKSGRGFYDYAAKPPTPTED